MTPAAISLIITLLFQGLTLLLQRKKLNVDSCSTLRTDLMNERTTLQNERAKLVEEIKDLVTRCEKLEDENSKLQKRVLALELENIKLTALLGEAVNAEL